MKNKEKNISVQLQIDLDSLTRVVGTIKEGTSNLEVDEINIKLTESLKKVFDGLTDWIGDFQILISENKHLAAYEILNKNKGTLKYSKNEVLEIFQKLNRESLNKEQRKDFLLVLIALASKESKFGKIENEIECLLTELGDELSPDIKQSVILSKANAAAQNSKLNVANTNYKKVIESKDSSSTDIAYAYRGLAKISASREDIIHYHQQTSDKFIEAGNKKEAIKDLVFLSRMQEVENPDKAIELIDTAISLYDGEQNLDKEYAASLYHGKSSYLFSINKYEPALENAEIACNLRENLFGIEHEKLSSYYLAKSLCEKLKLTEKISYYNDKIEVIKPRIQSEEFQLQQYLMDCNLKKEKVENGLLKNIEKSNYLYLKFSAYIFNGLNDLYSFEEKIEWLDKAKVIINDNDFNNQHYSLLYFTFAEIYRLNSDIDEAVKNYENSLVYNPFYYQAIQNCGAILWQNKKWEKSKDFFQKQIDKLGESPTLCYALGRSFFELKNYQDAFTNFMKAKKNEVKGVDISRYINLCIDNDSNIKLDKGKPEIFQIEAPISIESFKQTLEQFAKTVSSNSRMHFWANKSGAYKWASNPEERGKHLLITALETKYGKESIDIIEERTAGAGLIDLYVILRGGLKIVIELKICGGSGYSLSYALSGEDQLIHYLKQVNTNLGFLIVFDGRIRDSGKGFKAIQTIGNVTIFTTGIDMNPKIEK